MKKLFFSINIFLLTLSFKIYAASPVEAIEVTIIIHKGSEDCSIRFEANDKRVVDGVPYSAIPERDIPSIPRLRIPEGKKAAHTVLKNLLRGEQYSLSGYINDNIFFINIPFRVPDSFLPGSHIKVDIDKYLPLQCFKELRKIYKKGVEQ